MKACFLLQRRFAYVGHAMALTFKKKYGINEFCGYVELRSSLEFLKSQKNINYTQLLLDEDVQKRYKNEPLDLNYLKYLEQEYGIPNLWPYIELDRVVRYDQLVREYPYNTPKYTHEEMMKIVQADAKEIIKFFQEEKPDFIIFSAIASIDNMLLYQIARKMGIRTFLIRTSRIGAKFSITENYKRMDYIEKTFDEIRKNRAPYQNHIIEAEKFLKEFRDKPFSLSTDIAKSRPTTRRKQFAFLIPDKMLRSLGWLIRLTYDYFLDENRDDYTTIKPWHYVLDRIKRKIRVLAGFGKFYDEINPNEDFAFFPLHVEPEMSTTFYAPFYADQLWLIKQVARSLPIHYKLYVKEHPAMFGYRPRKYYKELKKIPNVKLIKPTIISFDLAKNARLLITISSNVAWEALLFKKPVITFGNGFYNAIPMVKNCRAIEDLPQIVKEQLENFNYDEEEMINFIAAIYKESVDADMHQLWDVEGAGKMEKKEKELIPLVDLIAQKLGLKPVENKV